MISRLQWLVGSKTCTGIACKDLRLWQCRASLYRASEQIREAGTEYPELQER